MRISEKAVDRPRLVIIGAIAICLLGFMALKQLPLERTPRVSLPLIIVATPNVGAEPAENETDIIEKIEKEAKGIDDLDHYESTSAKGAGVVTFKFTDKADIDDAKREVQEAVNRRKREFPDNAEEPEVMDISFTDWPIIQIIVTGGGGPKELRQIAEQIQDEVEGLEGVAAADLFGGQEREAQVLINPHRMVELGLGYEDIARAVRSANQSLPPGQTEGDAVISDVQFRGKLETIDQIADVVIEHRAGNNVLIRDVADVVDGFKRVTSLSTYAGAESVVLEVRPKTEINTLDTIAKVKEVVAREQERLGEQARLDLAADTAWEIRMMVRQLSGSAMFGVGLVILVLWIFMGLRNALIISFAIPFSILFAFAILLVVNLTIDENAVINNMVLFSMILVIGMVIDGALIVGENIFRHIEAGVDNRNAAKIGIREVGPAVIAADLTTICAFLPMLLVSGIMGEFLKFMPIVVAMALTASILVDHFLLPVLARYVMRHGAGKLTSAVGDGIPDAADGGRPDVSADAVRRSADATRFAGHYRRVIEWSLRHRLLTLMIVVLGIGIAATTVVVGLIGFEFFPKSDLSYFRINYEMPPGTDIRQTLVVGNELAAAAEQTCRRGELKSKPIVTVGQAGGFMAGFEQNNKSGQEYGTIHIELVMAEDRERSTRQIVDDIRDRLPNLEKVKDIRIEEMKEGPPAGAALVIRLRSSSDRTIDELGRGAERLERILRRTPGAKDVSSDWLLQRKIQIAAKPQLAAMADITKGQIDTYKSYALNGVVVAESNFGGDESIDIRVQNAPAFRTRDALARLPVRSATGKVRELDEVADIRQDVLAPYAINHRDGNRVISLRSETRDGYIAEDVQRNFIGGLEKAGLGLDELNRQGFSLEFGGENEERDRTMKDLSTAWLLGVIGIVVILVIQFDSFIQPLIVMLAIPLSFVGVIIGLVVTGYNFSIATMIGVVALAGIVVNDAIVLLTFINQLRALGMSKTEAIIRGGQLRLRPIFLTTVTTIVGLLPLTLDLSGGGQFWRPLTTSIMFGLAFATGLTLVILPVAYSLLCPETRPAGERAADLAGESVVAAANQPSV